MAIYNSYNLANENLWIKTADVAFNSPNKARALGVTGQLALTAMSPIVLPLATLELLLRTIAACGSCVRSKHNLPELKNAYQNLTQAFKDTLCIPLTVVAKIVQLITFVLFPMKYAATITLGHECKRFIRAFKLTSFMKEMFVYQIAHFIADMALEENYYFFDTNLDTEQERFNAKFNQFKENEGLYNKIKEGLHQNHTDNDENIDQLKRCLFNFEITWEEIHTRYQEVLFPLAKLEAQSTYDSFLQRNNAVLLPIQKEILERQLRNFCSQYDPKELVFSPKRADLDWRLRIYNEMFSQIPQDEHAIFMCFLSENKTEAEIREDFSRHLVSSGARASEQKVPS